MPLAGFELNYLGLQAVVEPTLLVWVAKFEEHQKEHDRCRMIYKYALEHLPKSSCEDIFKSYTIHEKKYGDRTGIEDVITSKRKFQYEAVNII